VLPQVRDLVRTIDYYAGTGNPRTITSEIGGVTQITYDGDGLHPASVTDAAGNLTTTTGHALCSSPTAAVDPNQQQTTTTYDALCRPVRTAGPLGGFEERSYLNLGDPGAQHTRVESPGTSGNDFSEQYFDGLGRVYRTRKRGPSAGETIVTERAYDARGNFATMTAPFYENGAPDVTAYSYDAFDRVTLVDPPDHHQTTKTYDLWKETTEDANGRARAVEWTSVQTKRESQTINGEEATTRHDFDALGRLKVLHDARDNQWLWSYDSLGRVFPNQIDPDAGARTFTYDETTRTNTQTDAKGQTITQRYDAAGRTLTKSSAAGTTTYTYGESRSGYFNAGRLTTVSTPAVGASPAIALQLDYDARGQVKKQTRTIGGSVFSVTKAYDAAGRATSLSFTPDGDAFGPFAYDAAGRLLSVAGVLASVTYDAAGRPLVQTNGNGTVTTRTYWPQRGLLHTLNTTSGGSTIQSLSYEDYDSVGLLKRVTGVAAGEGWQYDYDDGYRMTTATNLTTPADSQAFTYDVFGRITSNSRVGPYQYPSDGQPRPHAPTSVNGVGYSYDPNGNLTSGGGRTPQWDAENRITSIGTTQFAYDDAGERVKKTTGGATSLYPFGDDYEVTNGVTTKYLSVEGLGVIAKRVTGGPDPGLFWLHTDRLGSIQQVTRTNGASVLGRTYRPYGETLTNSGSNTESRGWIDQRNDAETELTDLHARYFDSRLGLFLSPDPMGIQAGVNQYAYAHGDPINLSDRLGLCVVVLIDGKWHCSETVNIDGDDNGNSAGGTTDGTRPPGGGCVNSNFSGRGNCHQNNGHEGTCKPGTPGCPKPETPEQPKTPVPEATPTTTTSPKRTPAFTIEGGAFLKVGGNGSFTIGQEGWGFCVMPGFGLGFEGNIAPKTRLPKTGLIVQAKASLTTTVSGGGAYQGSVTADPKGDPLGAPQPALETQWQRPGGEQYTKDLLTGETTHSFNLGADLVARLSAGVCIAVQY
jgi:RHS repeat-associated protein